MATLSLAPLLEGHVFAFLMLLARLGAGVMLFPGIGDSYVPGQVKMMFIAALCLLLVPLLAPTLPPLPDTPAGMVRLLGGEILVGVFFGSILRLFLEALEAAGAIIGLQTGLSNAMMLNPTLGTQNGLAGALLVLLGVTLLFVTDGANLLLHALLETYTVFPPGAPLPTGDWATAYAKTLSRSLNVGLEIGAPFMILGILFYGSLGVIQRLLPQVQLFLVTLPLEIVGGLMLLAATLSAGMAFWLNYVNAVGGAMAGLE